MSRIGVRVGLLFAVAAIALSGAPSAAAQSNAVQIVLSAQIPPGTTTGTLGPFGFWIWCEAPSGRPYSGECAGSMYFYDLGLVSSVDDSAPPVVTSSSVMVSVASDDGKIACTLSAPLPASVGATNTVSVNCSAPNRAGTINRAVVRVTGP
jgi:hypothetical protein